MISKIRGVVGRGTAKLVMQDLSWKKRRNTPFWFHPMKDLVSRPRQHAGGELNKQGTETGNRNAIIQVKEIAQPPHDLL
jgi:hypothetical protein